MLSLSRSLKGLVGAAALAVACTTTVQAGDFVGLDSFTGDFYTIDSASGAAANQGPLAGAPPFGFGIMDRAPNGDLYATSPGLFSGYSVYQIDQGALSATSLFSVATNATGGVGLAVDPAGSSVWVAGFVGLSLNVVLDEIDLGTGAILTTHNTLGGNMWGLAFDGAGNLYSTMQGASNPQLIQIDTVTGTPTLVGTEMAGVDMSFGVDLASDVGSGNMYVISRATDTIYTVDTTTGQATPFSVLTGGAAIFTFAEDNVFAPDFLGLDAAAAELYEMDSVNGKSKNLGPLAGAPPFGIAGLDRAPNGDVYTVSPGLFSGYSIYKIDPVALSATSVHSISTNITGGVGIAVDSSGTSAWVAGFVGFSLLVDLQQVDLATGALVLTHKTLAGNMWGLAFDGTGNLYSTMQGATGPQLIQIDLLTGTPTNIGTDMTNVDMSFGIDLASSTDAGKISLFSRNTDDMYTVDTTTGVATLVNTVAGTSNVFSIGPYPQGCTTVLAYGAGCAGSGGQVPEMSMDGCPAKGAQVSMNITNGLGGSSSLILFGLGQGSTPVGGGCNLLLSSVQPLMLFVPLGGVGPGMGSVTLTGVIPAMAPSATFTSQAFVGDVASPTGYSTTNGLQITIP